MPLLDGKPIERVPPPAVDSTASRPQGWQIRFTDELFDDYDKYLERMALYRRTIWTCSASGQSGLTYEQALLSERASYHRTTGIGFSDALICEMLLFISQSRLPISQAIDALYYRFLYDFFLGEHLDVKYPDTQGAMYECVVVGIGALPHAMSAEMQTGAQIAIERLGDSAPEIINMEGRMQRLFTVRLFDMDGMPIDDSDITVPASELSRSRNVFTKVALRQFLDAHTLRGSRPGSPWIIRFTWRERFRIPYMYRGQALLLRGPAARPPPPAPEPARVAIAQLLNTEVDPHPDERQLLVKPFRRLPIEDLDFIQYNHIKNRAGLLWALRDRVEKKKQKITDFFPRDNAEEPEELQRWPVPITTWQVPSALVSRTLATYMFISCFSTPLSLDPYPLDYFETALVHEQPGQAPDPSTACFSTVYRETTIALLNSIIADRKRTQLPSNVEARVSLMVEYQNENMSDQEDEEPVAATVIGTDEHAMDVDKPIKQLEPPVRQLEKPVALQKPPTASRLSSRSAKLRANKTIAQQLQNGDDNAIARRTRHSRLQYSSTMGTSSTDPSDDEEEEEEEDIKPKRKRGRPPKSKPATPVVSDSEDVAVDDDSTMDVDGQSNDVPSVDLTAMRPHALIRHLSRTWAASKITSGTWAVTLIGWLNEAAYDYQELTAIYEQLWADDSLTSTNLESKLHKILTAEQRLLLLELLVGECTNNESIRDYLDQCSEVTAELKRERLELRREAKKITESLANLDRADAADLLITPGANVSRATGRKEKEEEQQRQRERRRLGESERTVARRLDHIERELRRHNIGRLTPIGCDRFFSRYYFLDGVGGCPLTGGCGRVLVQPATKDDCNDALARLPRFARNTWALELPPAWRHVICDEDEQLQQLAFPNPSESLPPNDDLWGYYATTAQLDQLKKWLDPRGKRDSALLSELELLQNYVSGSIRRRCQMLEQSYMVQVRRREHICEQIAMHMDSEEPDQELERLQQELASIDQCEVSRALLPPARLLADDEISAGISRASSNEATPNADTAMSTTGYSSRASSVEPPSSVDGMSRKLPGKPARGRRPKNRAPATKTYLDEFLAYENK